MTEARRLRGDLRPVPTTVVTVRRINPTTALAQSTHTTVTVQPMVVVVAVVTAPLTEVAIAHQHGKLARVRHMHTTPFQPELRRLPTRAHYTAVVAAVVAVAVAVAAQTMTPGAPVPRPHTVEATVQLPRQPRIPSTMAGAIRPQQRLPAPLMPQLLGHPISAPRRPVLQSTHPHPVAFPIRLVVLEHRRQRRMEGGAVARAVPVQSLHRHRLQLGTTMRPRRLLTERRKRRQPVGRDMLTTTMIIDRVV